MSVATTSWPLCRRSPSRCWRRGPLNTGFGALRCGGSLCRSLCGRSRCDGSPCAGPTPPESGSATELCRRRPARRSRRPPGEGPTACRTGGFRGVPTRVLSSWLTTSGGFVAYRSARCSRFGRVGSDRLDGVRCLRPRRRYPHRHRFRSTSASLRGSPRATRLPRPHRRVPTSPAYRRQTHPDPVVLVHGTAENQDDNWQALSPMLADNGYCVYSFNYGGPTPDSSIQGTGDIPTSAGSVGHLRSTRS